ncbi:MAG: hypothetical protein KTR16_02435 [Acidiferrobacterales bacterium]|nr:hypothetical protein [Acidiferrobacterales bacterium]
MKNLTVNKKSLVRSALVATLLVAFPTFAQVDVSEATSQLAAAATAIGAVFAALLATKGAMIVIPWVLSVMGKR